MPTFIRGVAVRTPYTADGDAVYEWDVAITVQGGRTLHVLDTMPRLTDQFMFEPQRAYTWIVSPFFEVDARYFPPTHPPVGIGHWDNATWWESPIWWGAILRDLHWRAPAMSALVSALTIGEEWMVAETPVGDMLIRDAIDGRPMCVGGVIVWRNLHWFRLHAVLS